MRLKLKSTILFHLHPIALYGLESLTIARTGIERHVAFERKVMRKIREHI